MTTDTWADGDAYEAYVGRWSRAVAIEFIGRLDRPAGGDWLDVGCGTGALTATALALAGPARIVGVDPSAGFLATAAARITDARASFQRGDAQALPLLDGAFDTVVSGLALNFVPDARAAAAEFVRVLRSGGTAAAYVWDYAEGMQMMRHFWQAAVDVDPGATGLDEANRFPLCRPEPLRELWAGAGLRDAAVEPIVIPTVFTDFDDLWRPFLGGTGSAPTYVLSLGEQHRDRLRDELRARLPIESDGTIRLTARAWAVHGIAQP
jgi:SAM-dependent methyltransferase